MIRPIATLLAIVLELNGVYHEGDLSMKYGFAYVTMIMNSSVCYALYVLACFYLELGKKLKPYKPMAKFLCLKFVIFFIFWQSIVVSVLLHAGLITTIGDYSHQDSARAIQDFLICLEMVVASVTMQVAFTYRPYTAEALRQSLFERVAQGAAFAYSPLERGEVCAPMNYFGLDDQLVSTYASQVQQKKDLQNKKETQRDALGVKMSPHAPRSLVGGPGKKQCTVSAGVDPDSEDVDDIVLFSIDGEIATSRQQELGIYSPATAHQLESTATISGQNAPSSTSALLNRNFASATALRDFNQMLLPVLLPTGFEPSKGVVVYSNPLDRMRSHQKSDKVAAPKKNTIQEYDSSRGTRVLRNTNALKARSSERVELSRIRARYHPPTDEVIAGSDTYSDDEEDIVFFDTVDGER